MMLAIKSLVKSFRFAFEGLKYCIKNERNFRIHLVAVFYVLFFSHIAKLSSTEFSIILICFAQVLAGELFNTSIESLGNKDGKEFNLFIKNAKDISASAVLVCAIICVVIGFTIFTPKIHIVLENLTAIYKGILIIMTPINLWFIFKGRK